MSPGKLATAIVGAIVALVAIGLIGAGAGLLFAYETARTDDGFFTTPSTGLSTQAYALTSSDIDFGSRPGDWFPSGQVATVRLDVETQAPSPVFVGIGPVENVDAYLDGVAHAEVTRVGPDPTYRAFDGSAPSALPADQDFWVASSEGAGLQTLTWDLEQGEWAVVIMNADAAADVDIEAAAGVQTELVVLIGALLILGGLMVGSVAAILLVVALRRTTASTGETAEMPGDRYPVTLEAQLDPQVSRWKWLFKWLLVTPHFVVLAFLYVAYALTTVIAGFAILFTGHYPRSIFDFNVGVLRWSWRVGYYSYSALGTDRYPPFTLADVDYPARFDVAYPDQLSRGLVLVKWWLLAIPHYVVVGLFTSGLVWWTNELGADGNSVLRLGGGLIGLLVLVAGMALAFGGRYPQGLFDLIVGLNRWVFRVVAYASLMRDEYPPFRLDMGGLEPGETPPAPPEGTDGSGTVPVEPHLSRI